MVPEPEKEPSVYKLIVTGPEERVVAGTLAELLAQPPEAFGEPLHSLVIVGRRLHHLEVEYAESFALNRTTWRDVAKRVYGCSLD